MQKKIVYISLFISFICVIVSGCIENSPSNGGHILHVNKENYTSISDAIKAANDNDTILVSKGTYHEMIIIEKSIKLIAEEPNNTIITYIEGHHDHPDFIQINAKGCTIEGFTILGDYPLTNASGISIFTSNNTVTHNNLFNADYGICVYSHSENNILSYNTFINSNAGIFVYASHNYICNNTLINNTFGIYLNDCSFNNIFLNNVSGNNWGIRLRGATSNQLYTNQIQNNVKGVYSCCGAMQNTIFKNNFINNSQNAYDDFTSSWYKNTIGNYWSDYRNLYPNAQSHDNIWDTLYSIPGGDNQDKYPLVKPFSASFS
ncbi:Periplasmic copper-binding protein (NosD) [uncultured archaeon]|nr:Periplasmic copper-binding protein (NosD) [uncultured archaeon]